MRLAVAFACLAFAVPAWAQDLPGNGTPGQRHPGKALPGEETLEVGGGLVCDTAEQIRRYVEVFRGDAEAAAQAVNREVGQAHACTFALMAFVRGATVQQAQSFMQERVQIAEVLVLALATPAGFRPIQPVRWFTIFPVEEVKA
jgi:hypothetical protein